jgi:abortive infection bacteriophage resistance protein
MKQATTVENQLNILKNRGMTISNDTKAKEILGDVVYFVLLH